MGGAPFGIWGVAAAAFAFGHGIHVAANSIHDLVAGSGAGDPTGLLDFWDERAGHYLVDFARLLFAAALTHRAAGAGDVGAAGSGVGDAGARMAAETAGARMAAAIAGGVVFGFTLFASAVEGQTVPLVLPASALYAAWSALARGNRGAVRLFLAAAAWTAVLLFAVWGVWQGGFPEFTRAGLIRSAP
jgi:hypothetical protein